jgi:Trk K+ transport system NAD-binding subunit
MKTPGELKLYVRYAWYLVREFRWPIGVFSALVLLGGLLLRTLYHRHELTYPQACYEVFLLIFLQADLDDFPDEWYLQPTFFLLPIVGLGAVADSVVRLAYLIFAQKRKLPEWQRMVASLYRKHIVIVGVGKVGLRIIRGLLDLCEPVVAIERQESSLFLDEVRDRGVPVITGDGRQQKTLEQAGVKQARAIILATDDDLTNLDGALTARDIHPGIHVVMRLFDDTLAEKVGGAFSMPAISASQVAAPAFIAAATGRKVYHEFQLDNRRVHLTDLTIRAGGSLVGRSVGDIQADKEVNIVMHRGPSGVNVNPGHDLVLAASDTILVIAPMERLVDLESANQPGQ